MYWVFEGLISYMYPSAHENTRWRKMWWFEIWKFWIFQPTRKSQHTKSYHWSSQNTSKPKIQIFKTFMSQTVTFAISCFRLRWDTRPYLDHAKIPENKTIITDRPKTLLNSNIYSKLSSSQTFTFSISKYWASYLPSCRCLTIITHR